jgi:hypothetical protein
MGPCDVNSASPTFFRKKLNPNSQTHTYASQALTCAIQTPTYALQTLYLRFTSLYLRFTSLHKPLLSLTYFFQAITYALQDLPLYRLAHELSFRLSHIFTSPLASSSTRMLLKDLSDMCVSLVFSFFFINLYPGT